MYETTRALIENLLAPMVSVQIFLSILIYFTIVRKRIAADYKLYVCFLATFILFLAGRSLQEWASPTLWPLVLYSRMVLLFAIGIPSLLVATAVQSGIQRSKPLFIWPYVVGMLISVGYVVFADVEMQQLFISRKLLANLPFEFPVRMSHTFQIAGAMILLVLPCGGLIIKELCGRRNPKLLAFLAGAFLFGLFMVLGTIPRNYGLYYVGSIISGWCWGWAIFRDIRDMKSKVTLLKEELQLVVQSGQGSRTSKIEKLLLNLEEVSRGNLDVYKMRIREILSMLTDATIEAGGDTDSLILRNAERGHAIETSTDPQAILAIIRTEAVELSDMIADIPDKKNRALIEQAMAYLTDHYGEDVCIEELAHSLHVSRSHFMREFKKGTGQTAKQYLTAIRMEQAKRLLVEKSVTETAFEVGYNNSNYFSTVFKKQTGRSPIAFQKEMQGEPTLRSYEG